MPNLKRIIELLRIDGTITNPLDIIDRVDEKTLVKVLAYVILELEKGEIKNPNGRPKKFVGAVLDELKKQGFGNITRRNVVDIYETLLSLPRDGLVDIASGKQYPMIYRIVAKDMLS